MKYTALLSLALLLLLIFFIKRTKMGRELVQHFYFQTFILLFLIVNLIFRLIHFKLTFWSILAVAVLCLCLATGIPHYLQKLKKRIGK
jgi:Ca2+/Na+ antiporter